MSDTEITQIKLPERLASSADLARLIRELEAVDESLRQAALRKPGEPTQLSRTSVTLEELAAINGIQLTDASQRQQLIELVTAFDRHAPRIKMSFASEPTAKFTHKLTVWLRQNVHPLTLLEVGLQPTIAAGCTVRTDNKIFDMSLRHHLADSRKILVQKIAEIGQKLEHEAEAAAIAAAAAAPTQAPAPAPAAAPAPVQAAAPVTAEVAQ